MRGSLNIINRPIEAWLDVHYELVRLLSPSSFEVKCDGRRTRVNSANSSQLELELKLKLKVYPSPKIPSLTHAQ